MGNIALFLGYGAEGAAPGDEVTWNPADIGPDLSLSSGNLLVAKSSGADGYSSVRATEARSATDAGGFYFEVVITSASVSQFIMVGVANSSAPLNAHIGSTANGWSYYQQNGDKYTNNAAAAYGSSFETDDVIGVFLKNGKLYFRRNGTWQNSADVDAETGEAFSGLSGMLFPAVSLFRVTSPRHELTGRFKASAFSGSIPTGAAAWES